MPYKPRKRSIKRKDDRVPLNDRQLEHLLFGWTWIDNDFPFESENHRRQCWERHKNEIMAMMTDDESDSGLHPYLLVGMRPAAWFEYEDVPERKITTKKHRPGNPPGKLEVEISEIQSIPDYLDEHSLWFTDEKRRYIRMMERKEKQIAGIRNVTNLDDFRNLPKIKKETET
jgi:hypothetical protein